MQWLGITSEDAVDKCICPKCGARPGFQCVTSSGIETTCHGSRCTEVKKLAASLKVDPWKYESYTLTTRELLNNFS